MADIISTELLGSQTGIDDNLSVILGASAASTDDVYNGKIIDITIGTLVMTRTITDYTGSTKKAILNSPLDKDPSASDTYRVYSETSSAFEITPDTVKLYMNLSTSETKYDTLIADVIDLAYGKLDVYVGYDPATGIFSEFSEMTLKDTIFTGGIAKDIVLSEVEIENEAISLSDLTQVDFNRWKIEPEDYADLITECAPGRPPMFYVEYSSEKLLAKINRLLLEVIIFELKKLPAFENLIIRKSKMIQDIVTEQYVSDESFYGQIDKKFSELFLRKF